MVAVTAKLGLMQHKWPVGVTLKFSLRPFVSLRVSG